MYNLQRETASLIHFTHAILNFPVQMGFLEKGTAFSISTSINRSLLALHRYLRPLIAYRMFQQCLTWFHSLEQAFAPLLTNHLVALQSHTCLIQRRLTTNTIFGKSGNHSLGGLIHCCLQHKTMVPASAKNHFRTGAATLLHPCCNKYSAYRFACTM